MVICDTSVLYDIANGIIKPEWFKDEKLAATFMSAFEFSNSYKLIEKMKDVRKAAEVMKNCEIINEDAPDFAIKRLIPDYKVNPDGWKQVGESFQLLLTNDFVSEGDNAKIARRVIDNYKKPFDDSVDKVNLLLEQRQRKPTHKEKEEVRNADLTEYHKKEIIGLLQQHLLVNNPTQQISLDINAKGWEDLEFFVNVYTDYNKDFFQKEDKRMKKNDWIDFWIMAYVGKNDLLWTMEKYWIGLINSNPVTAKYLHPLSGRRA